MVLAEFSMFPVDRGESLSQYVAKILDVIDKSGLNYRLTPMGTIIEGTWDEVMATITGCFNTMAQYSNRISVSIKIDFRRGYESRMKTKVEKIEQLLSRKLH